MVKPVVFQVAGYQNSGKTTTTMRLIQSLSAIGLKTVTLKHHGHGGKPNIADNKDSVRHISAGAAAALVDGDGRLILQAENLSASLEEKLLLLHFFKPDVIIIEGYKKENYPKLLIIKDQADLPLIEATTNVRMIIYWDATLEDTLIGKVDVPFFSIRDETFITRICDVIKELIHENDSAV